MAYRSRRRVSRRPVTRRRRVTRTKRMRRTYATSRRPRFSGRKRILNVTSRKKRDHMLQILKPSLLSPVTGSPGAIDFSPSANGGSTVTAYGWVATARDQTYQPPGDVGSIIDDATRTATKCYIKGISERMEFTTSGPTPFQHRRIVFTFVGQELVRDNGSAAVGSMWAEANPPGYFRATTRLLPHDAPNAFGWDQLTAVLFKGVRDADWVNVMIAPVDNSRVRLLSDRIKTYNIPNESGVIKEEKYWHPVNKTLIYNDDEDGGGTLRTQLSANNRQSVGDVYIIDLFSVSPAVGTEDHFLFDIQSTLYWHER